MVLKAILRNSMRNATFDSTSPAANHRKSENDLAVMDAADYQAAQLAQEAVAAIHTWVESDVDLDSGETLADRLFSLFIGIADATKDGDLSDDEIGVVEAAMDAGAEYLASLGVDDGDIDALLNSWDEDAAERVHEFILSSLPDDGEDSALDSALDFTFVQKDAFFDSTYVNRVAIRGGKKVRIKKRVTGSVHLTARQKVAIRKMHLKANSASAKMRRLKSMRTRKKMGI